MKLASPADETLQPTPTARRNSGEAFRPGARLSLTVRGAVQGVGFRPFIYRLATSLGLRGWVNNSPQGVFAEVEGPRGTLEQFLVRIEAEKPPRSSIRSLECCWLDTAGYRDFEIRASGTIGGRSALVLPDFATCADCRREIFDPANRRYRYPFTNCTHCGPRFSLMEALPYDRANTSMKAFTMCALCQAEYDDPRDRRFHAQPNACPACGPHVELWGGAGLVQSVKEEALGQAAECIRRGGVVAVKGLGGFQLVVDARNDEAVRRLRDRKHREEKPFAVMFPSVGCVKALCEVSPLEERLLCSPEAPIVLLKRRPQGANLAFQIAPSVAPGNPNLGVMLPYTPLHHLLLAELEFAVVATSGNLADEPICTEEHDALKRLRSVADLFLIHNRPIVRHMDDSIVRVMMDRELVLRRARGYAPLPIRIKSGNRSPTSETIVAMGGHLKNTVALAIDDQVFLSQHIGDLETVEAFAAFERAAADLARLYEVQPDVIASDLHPDYLSTKHAFKCSAGVRVQVQHHFAHALSCMAENEVTAPALGVIWDGTGYGPDGTIWGGEFLKIASPASFLRFAHFRPFRLPGGDKAMREPRRTALGVLHDLFGEAAFGMKALAPVGCFSAGELRALRSMLNHGSNAPFTSSVGRLFDAVAALIGLRQHARFEGQAAMELEFAAAGIPTGDAYSIRLENGQVDWRPMLDEILNDIQAGIAAELISAKFHNALVKTIVAIALAAGEVQVVLSGGCFQNRCLTERAVNRLRAEGFRPYWHQWVPPNDGGLALGQIMAALDREAPARHPCNASS